MYKMKYKIAYNELIRTICIDYDTYNKIIRTICIDYDAYDEMHCIKLK